MDTDTDFISLGNDHDPAVIEALSVADRPPSFKRKRTDHEDDSWLLGRADHGRNSSKRPTFEAVLGRKLRATEPPEWMSGRQYSYQASMMRALHEEVIDFVKYVEPPPEEHQARCEVLAEIRETVGEHLGPGATVYIFGSFETQLYLPHGDIDVVIMEQSTVNVKKQLGKLHREMLRDRLYTQAEFIWSARVPIIKVCSRKYGIPIDISMNQATGLSTAEFVKHQMELMPALRPLALVLKMFLYQRDLNEVANGGIGSYTIIVMLCCFLRAHPLVARKEIVAEDNLGVLLMDFLETFGMDINTEQVAITAQGFMEKRMADRYFSRMGESNKFTVVDPLDDTHEANNLTRGASHTRTIQSAFLSAFETLKRVVMYWTEAVSSNSTDTPPTLLGYILRVNPAVMQRRDRIVRLYRHIQQGGEVPDRNNAGASSSSSYGGNGDASRHSADKPANGSNSEQGHAGSGGTEHRKHHKQRAAKGAKDSAGSAATETKASKKKHQSKKQAAKEKAEAENADKPAVETPPSKRSKKIKKGKKGKKENGDSGPATLQPAKKPKPAKKTKAQRAKATADSMPSPSAADLRTQPNLAVVVPVLPSAAKPAEPAAALLRKRRKVAATSHTHGNLVTASA
ncbi:hypothetical protein RI367_001708 [Sorochytrium milnesiophthora]